MRFKRSIVLFTALSLVAAFAAAPATAGKKKKKGPKPYTSSEGAVMVPHTMLVSSTDRVNSVTAYEFEARCDIPATNGVDAYVWEVPADYQKIESTITSFGDGGSHQLYVFFYKADCTRQTYYLSPSTNTDLETETAPEGIMPKDTAFVLVSNFLGHPGVKVWFELKP